MALINCPECGRANVSNNAKACPDCGFPVQEYFIQQEKQRLAKMEPEQGTQQNQERKGIPDKPRRFRFIILCIVGIVSFILMFAFESNILLFTLSCIGFIASIGALGDYIDEVKKFKPEQEYIE